MAKETAKDRPLCGPVKKEKNGLPSSQCNILIPIIGISLYQHTGEALYVASEKGHLTLVETVFQRIETLRDRWHPYNCVYWVAEALADAGKHSYLDIVQFLVDKGANVNARTEDGTSLILAAAAGQGDVVKYLLEKALVMSPLTTVDSPRSKKLPLWEMLKA